jgi:hypothetical protein
MKRLLFLGVMLAAAMAFMPAAGAAPTLSRQALFNCDDNGALCTEPNEANSYEGTYIGHDEPSILFYSDKAGAGNSQTYKLTLPTDPPMQPTQDGTGGTWNFQLHPAFWFGVAMCDDQSAPNPGGSPSFGATVPCKSDSNANIYDSDNPASSSYIGRHPGGAYEEMQFYPPGWSGAVSCDATQWCAALTIDSFNQNQDTGVNNNNACLSTVGIEPVNFAFITRNGVSQAPANPVEATDATFTPDPSKDLFMGSGDDLVVTLHDTPQGFQVRIHDETTHQDGSMTASVANDFGKVVFDPSASTCTVQHDAFHPMYASSSEHTRLTWTAHGYNVAYSDEIGHFEYCNATTQEGGRCTQDGVGDADSAFDGAEDDFGCFSGASSFLVQVTGCLSTDVDFDGVPYQPVWPGSTAKPDKKRQSTPIVFSSPTTKHGENYDRVAFEADLPRIEFDTNPPCQRFISNPASPNPGQDCVNPPKGANFYPMFVAVKRGDTCSWAEGGPNIKTGPGEKTNTFGGSSATEFGPLLTLFYPVANGQPSYRYNNFRNVVDSNPCTSRR